MDSRIITIHRDLSSGKRSCFDLMQEKLTSLSANTYHTANLLFTESALEQAKQVDGKIKSGQPIGLLEGVPFGIQDIILLQNSITTGGTAFLKNYNAPYTASAIQKLIDAGAIPVVKENCDCFGICNTGGSAVNVARGFTTFSIGGDTGGAIRQSAGYNQIYSLKPTYGRISRYGMMANMSSTDCIGPLASSLEDIRILINTMSGKDVKDPTTFSSSVLPPNVFDAGYLKNEIIVGFYKNFVDNEYLDDSIKNNFQKMLDIISAKGVKIKPLDFFDVNRMVSVFYVLAMAEEASNLARLDGSLYGDRAKSSARDGYMITRTDNFSKEMISRIVGGNMAISRENYEDIYLKARGLRNMIADRFDTCFKEVDVILSPIACRDVACNVSSLPLASTHGVHNTSTIPPDGAHPISTLPPADCSNPYDSLSIYLSDGFTVGFSLGGLPTMAVPFFTPTGIQITSNKNQEDVILNFARFLKEFQ